MNIKFKVNDTTYQLTSDRFQVILSEIRLVKSGENAGQETAVLVGYHKDEFQALKSVMSNEKYMSTCTSFEELEELNRKTLQRINEIADIYSWKR